MPERTCIMISSTLMDLPEHRKDVLEACLRQGMEPMRLERLPESDAQAMQVTLEMADRADVYLGILAHRYGHVPQGQAMSLVELEYNRVVERDIPCLMFLIDREHPIKIEEVEMGEGAARLAALKARVPVAGTFKSPADLRQQIISHLAALRKPDLLAFHYVGEIPAPPEAYIAHPYTLLQTRDLVGRQAELNALTDWVTPWHGDARATATILNIVAIGGMGKSALTWKWFNDIAPLEMRPLAGRLWWSFYESDATFENFVTRALAYVTTKPHEGAEPSQGLRTELRQNLAKHFDRDELRTLCFDMGIEDEDLPDTLNSMARDLVAHCERRDRLAELTDKCRELRPDAAWDVPTTLTARLREIEKIPLAEREARLLQTLDREPYLLVLDGLERILIAYARMDAAHLSYDDLDQRTANVIAQAVGLPQSAAQSFTGQHRLRKTADPRAGAFLRKLAGVRASRILVSTRLYPADLQMVTGYPVPGCAAIFMHGLSDDDALNLWRAMGVSGAREALLPLFHTFENHPLLLQALAGEVAHDRRAPGDFDGWRKAQPDFNPFQLPLVQVKSHVLEFALRGLSASSQQVLKLIAAFRMPATYETVAAVMVGGDKLFPDEKRLDAALTELEDRGLLGWDRRANRYDLHPIARGVVWNRLDEAARQGVYTHLHDHFEALPKIDDWHKVESLQDLTPAIELYNTLIGLGRYEDACDLFYARLEDATLYRLSASRQRAELLEALFPDGLDQLPRLSKPGDQPYTLNALALAYQFSGQPGRAAPLFRHSNEPDEKRSDMKGVSIGLGNLSNALRLAGQVCEAEAAARRALIITRQRDDHFQEAISLQWLGLTLAARGTAPESESALRRSLRMFITQSLAQSEGLVNTFLAQRAVWLGDPAAARTLADRAWELAHVQRVERDFIRAARLQGEAAFKTSKVLETFEVSYADERLHHALTRARAVNDVEEELAALVALAELRRRQGNTAAAREFLDDVWESAERGPYPLFAADAFNVLAHIERDAGNTAAAVEAATKAYTSAWCDGEPYAYHWGLVAARKHLRELGAPEPVQPPFDASKFEPMPEVEINPQDEFYVEENAT